MSDQDRQHDQDPVGPGRPEGPGADGEDDEPRGEAEAAGGDPGREPGGERAGGRSGRASGGASSAGGREAAGDGGEADAPGEDGSGDAGREGSGGGWGGAISEMQNLVGDVVGEVLEGVRGAAGRRFPRIDMVRRAGGDYVVLVDLPGVDRDSVKVTTLGGELTVSGERPRPELPEESEVLRTERGYGSFRRTVRLPPDIREEDVTARLEDGVLEIRLPRKSPSDAREVEIG